jgi:phosphoglycerate dehydrogenase-like enzyme
MKKEMHILVTWDLSTEQSSRIKKISDKISLSVIPAEKASAIPEDEWEKTDILYTTGVLPDPAQAPHLKWIQFQSAGIDPYRDHPLLQRKALLATTMSGVITSQIAEYVLMAMLAFGQKLPRLFHYQDEKKWPSESEKLENLLPHELRQSTVGIVGYGSIGRQVARLLQPFKATILASKKNVMEPEDEDYVMDGLGDPHGDFFNRLYPIEALHSMLGECDFVILALPLTDETFHLIDAAAFNAMKPIAYLINVGRGALIDQQALVAALQNKQIAGAALDVFEEEPLPVDSPLWELPNVIISPHISGLSRYLLEETFALFIENLNRYMADLPLYNQVNVQEGY